MGFARYQGPKLGRVLLVEGSAPLDASFSEHFRERGIDIYAAHGVRDARPLLPALRPDVTILDLDLGDGDAFDLIDRPDHPHAFGAAANCAIQLCDWERRAQFAEQMTAQVAAATLVGRQRAAGREAA